MFSQDRTCSICQTLYGDKGYARDCVRRGEFKKALQDKLETDKILTFYLSERKKVYFLPVKNVETNFVSESCLHSVLVIKGFCPKPVNLTRTIRISGNDNSLTLGDCTVSADYFFNHFKMLDVVCATKGGFEVFAPYDWERNASPEMQAAYITAISRKAAQTTALEKIIYGSQKIWPGTIGSHQASVALTNNNFDNNPLI